MKIKVNGSDFYFFNDITITRNLDSVASSFSFSAKFNPNNASHKELFRPLSYHTVEFFDDEGILLLTGTIINNGFTSTGETNLTPVSGYSLGGILEDCSIPLNAYPLESINRSLSDIAIKLLNIFSLKLVVDSTVMTEASAIYKKSVAGPSETIKSYLAKLAAQRNIVLSHDEKGNIILFRPDINAAPKFFFNNKNTKSISLKTNGQSLHSEVSVIRQPSENNSGVSLTDKINNPLVLKYRPITNVLSSGTETDTKKSANNKMASELSGIDVTVFLEEYLSIKPGDIVEIQEPEVFLYKRTRFIVKSVTVKNNTEGYSTSISLVLPESYTGDTPKNIFK